MAHEPGTTVGVSLISGLEFLVSGADDAFMTHMPAGKVRKIIEMLKHDWERGFIAGWDKANADFKAALGAHNSLREPPEITEARKALQSHG